VSEYEKAEKKSGAAPKLNSVAGKTEEEIYKALALEIMEPTLREDRGEIEAAGTKKLPKLIQLKDIRGDLHSHTVASDGKASIEEMAEAAKARGYEFLAITDHSKSSVIANGLSVERLMKHAAEIRRTSDKLKGITLLAGAEVDILVDGRLDYEDAVLKELDIVVASPHVSLKQDSEKATARILRAIENRYVTLIGHPTGRIIFGREGLPLNFPPIFKAAAQTGTALEINAAYPRLDLNDANAYGALKAGVKLAIDTDAHAIDQLNQMQFGIFVAQRAWATAAEVINCMTLAKLKEFIRKKRG
jgi:DNA polymerase (family 10)